VYGDPLEHPQTEKYWGNVNPIGPRGVYDEAKRFAEAMTMAYHRFHGIDTRIVRIFNTYGPRMRPHDWRVVSNFIVQALSDQSLTIYGTARRRGASVTYRMRSRDLSAVHARGQQPHELSGIRTSSPYGSSPSS
jgi:nucleoside-diphosphate-sugar epimerase